MERRGFDISSVFCRVESGSWYKKLAKWQEGWMPKGVRGASPRHECLNSVWFAPARLQEAMLRGDDGAEATLEYTKFFDRFDATFYGEMFVEMGYPPGLAKMQTGIYGSFVRYIKIVGSCGTHCFQRVGVGQRFSLSLLAANATVAIYMYI